MGSQLHSSAENRYQKSKLRLCPTNKSPKSDEEWPEFKKSKFEIEKILLGNIPGEVRRWSLHQTSGPQAATTLLRQYRPPPLRPHPVVLHIHCRRPIPLRSARMIFATTSTCGARVLVPVGQLARPASRPRHRQHSVSRPSTTAASSSTARSATYVRFRIEVWQDGRQRLLPRLRRARPGGADPVPGRHAGRHHGLVSLCGEVPGDSTAAG